MTARSWGLLGLLAAIWGSSYLFIALGLTDVSPVMLVFLRAALAAAVVVPLGLRYRHTLRGHWKAMPVLALTQVVAPFLLISFAEQRIPSSLAGVLVSSQPLWLAMLLPLLGAGRPTLVTGIGTLAGFGGVALVTGYDGSGAVDVAGVLMVLGAGLSYAVATWWARHAMTGVHPLAQTAAMLTTASIVLVPFAAFSLPSSIGLVSGGAILVVAVLGTGGAFIIFTWLVKNVGPARASLVSYLAPAFALGYGAVLLHEPVGVLSFVGLALVLAGSWLSTRTTLRIRRPAWRRRRAVAWQQPESCVDQPLP